MQKTKDSVNEKLEPCITAVKNYGAKKIRNGIEAALNSLPESLVPENVHCTKPAIIEDDDALELQSRRSSQQMSENLEIEGLPTQEPPQPNEADTRELTSEENPDQRSTGAINKTLSSVTAESSESSDKPQDIELKDPQNIEPTRKEDLGESDCQVDEISEMVSQEINIPKEAEQLNLKDSSEITSDTLEPASVENTAKTIEEFLCFERAHDAESSDLQKPPMA